MKGPLRPPFRQQPRLIYTIEEASELLSISRAQLYRLIEVNELPTVTIGRSRRITWAQLEAFVRTLEQTSGFVRLRDPRQ